MVIFIIYELEFDVRSYLLALMLAFIVLLISVEALLLLPMKYGNPKFQYKSQITTIVFKFAT